VNKPIWTAIALTVGAACVFIANKGATHRTSDSNESAALNQEAATPVESAKPGGAPVIAIPETTITLKRELRFKDNEGSIALSLPAGTQLVTESTQGLEFIVVRDRHTIRVHCDDAFESHGRFTDGRVEHLALQMAQELRAEGRAPTNERIVSRAIQAAEDRRLEGSPSDVESQLDSLQKVLLLHH
jgi:hypothetical protein